MNNPKEVVRPLRIWLLHNAGEGGSDVWCTDPDPEGSCSVDSTEYIRADAMPKVTMEGAVKVVANLYAYAFMKGKATPPRAVIQALRSAGLLNVVEG
jgi:hypothetical protein